MRKFFFYIAIAFLAFGISISFYYVVVYKGSEPIPNDVVEVENDSTKQNTEIKASTNSICSNKTLEIIWKTLDVTEKDEQTCESLLEIEEIKLSSDENTQYLISGKENKLCASGGCQIWVINDDEIIFETYGSFYKKDTKHNGFNDITSVFRVYSGGYEYTIYQFNGKKYVPSKCFSEEWTETDKNKKTIVLKLPKITHHSCKKDK